MKQRFFKTHFPLIISVDIFLLAMAWIVSGLVLSDFRANSETVAPLFRLACLSIPMQLIAFFFFGLYKGMWRYVGIDDLAAVVKASLSGSALLFILFAFFSDDIGLIRSVFVIQSALTIVLISGFRLSIPLLFLTAIGKEPLRITVGRIFLPRKPKKGDLKNLLIIGAGAFGEKIFREIRDNTELRYRVVGFVDDDQAKIGRQIHNTPVMGPIFAIRAIAERLRAKEGLIAISSATSDQMREIVGHCKAGGLPFKILPTVGELIHGKVTVSAIREVDYADLLGREPVHIDNQCIGTYLENKRVLVTGAGGSIGSELCRQICRFDPAKLILFERAETPLYEIDLELKNDFPLIPTHPALADIRNREQVSAIFEEHGPEVVFHAAAYKHVPMLETQPWEAVLNNVVGTRNLVEISARSLVDRFVLVSTDKAVRPVNIMGATKRVAEKLVQTFGILNSPKTRFVAVRFGNVIGSAGSVVQLFKKQIEKGGPVTVTHPEIVRYFMTIPEACRLILQAGGMGAGGEIFVLDMGKQIKIADMARDMIRLSGFEPDKDIKIVYTGLRPGEKLFEELITDGENMAPTNHAKIMALRAKSACPADFDADLDALESMARDRDVDGMMRTMRKVVPEFLQANNENGCCRHSPENSDNAGERCVCDIR